MIRIAQGSVAGLVRNLCERILSLPLTAFEANDHGALTAVLTEDVIALANALSAIPLVVIHMTVFIGCFLYLGIVSRALLVSTLLFAVPAIATHQFLAGRGRRLLGLARAEQDALVGHFRALVDGFKELKLHRERREAFLTESIRAASDRVRVRNVRGMTMLRWWRDGGEFLYFGYLGFLVFALPLMVDVPREVVISAVLTVVYAMSPLDGLLGAGSPVVARMRPRRADRGGSDFRSTQSGQTARARRRGGSLGAFLRPRGSGGHPYLSPRDRRRRVHARAGRPVGPSRRDALSRRRQWERENDAREALDRTVPARIGDDPL